MKLDQLLSTVANKAQQGTLKAQIAQLQLELDTLNAKVDAFEALLQSQLTHELIEEQELAILYKTQKAAKKAKRLAQKRRGKNYVEPVGLTSLQQPKNVSTLSEADAKTKKRLYREAMLHVHPDKFSMHDDRADLATELTTRLVEIYKQEDLATLIAYHAHLFSNSELTAYRSDSLDSKYLPTSSDAYLLMEIDRLKKAITAIHSKQTYQVLNTYTDPSTFIDELRAYYQDRVQKLRRRTRGK